MTFCDKVRLGVSDYCRYGLGSGLACVTTPLVPVSRVHPRISCDKTCSRKFSFLLALGYDAHSTFFGGHGFHGILEGRSSNPAGLTCVLQLLNSDFFASLNFCLLAIWSSNYLDPRMSHRSEGRYLPGLPHPAEQFCFG
jgi:hypothetical protein